MVVVNAEIQKFLSAIQPFKALLSGDLERIIQQAQAQGFSKGATIFSEGEAADSVWVLYKGRVQIFKYTSEGKAFAIESLSRGEIFGTLCRLGGNGRTYPCTAIAADAVTAIKILDRIFLEYYMKSPGLVRGVCSLCAERLKDVQDLRCMGQESVPIRITSILLRLSQVHGDTIPFTKKEIAELAGTTIETTFRTLAQLEKKGYLASERGRIRVKEASELRKISENT